MTPKNRTFEGKNPTLGGQKSSDIINIWSLSVEATLSVSLQIFFLNLSIWPFFSNIKLEGLSFLYSHSFMKNAHDSLTTFMPFELISQDFLKTCEMSWTCYNLTSFPISIQYTVKKYQHQLSQKKMYPCTHCVHLRFISSLAKRDWTSRSTANKGAHIVQPRCCQVNATNMARNI